MAATPPPARGLLGSVVRTTGYPQPSHRASPLVGTTGRKWRGRGGGGFREDGRPGEHGSVRGAPRPRPAEPPPDRGRAPRLPAGHPRVPQGRSPAGGSGDTAPGHRRGPGAARAGRRQEPCVNRNLCSEISAALRWDPRREVFVLAQRALFRGLQLGVVQGQAGPAIRGQLGDTASLSISSWLSSLPGKENPSVHFMDDLHKS